MAIGKCIDVPFEVRVAIFYLRPVVGIAWVKPSDRFPLIGDPVVIIIRRGGTRRVVGKVDDPVFVEWVEINLFYFYRQIVASLILGGVHDARIHRIARRQRRT